MRYRYISRIARTNVKYYNKTHILELALRPVFSTLGPVSVQYSLCSFYYSLTDITIIMPQTTQPTYQNLRTLTVLRVLSLRNERVINGLDYSLYPRRYSTKLLQSSPDLKITKMTGEAL